MTAGKPQPATLIDPELRELAAQMPLVEFTRDALPAIRSAIEAMLTTGEAPSMDGVAFREHWVERAGHSAVRLLHYCPESVPANPLPAILHVHGGGFVLGLPEMNHATNVALARDLQCHVVSVEYRLAPEWPYPAGLDDCQDALDWSSAKPMHSASTERGSGSKVRAPGVVLPLPWHCVTVITETIVLPFSTSSIRCLTIAQAPRRRYLIS